MPILNAPCRAFILRQIDARSTQFSRDVPVMAIVQAVNAEGGGLFTEDDVLLEVQQADQDGVIRWHQGGIPHGTVELN